MVPWWERWCGYQSQTVGLSLLRYADYARLGHQTLLWNKQAQIKLKKISLFLLLFASLGLCSWFSPPCFFNSQRRATDEPRAEPLQSFCQQGWACFTHAYSASQTLASTNQKLWSATVFTLIGTKVFQAVWGRASLMWRSSMGFWAGLQVHSRNANCGTGITRIKFPLWRMIKRRGFCKCRR